MEQNINFAYILAPRDELIGQSNDDMKKNEYHLVSAIA